MNQHTATKIFNDGRALTIREWSNELGIQKQTIRQRHNKGIPINHCFRISRKRIGEAVAVYRRTRASAKTKMKIYKAFSQYLKKMKYREIRNAYQMELTQAA